LPALRASDGSPRCLSSQQCRCAAPVSRAPSPPSRPAWRWPPASPRAAAAARRKRTPQAPRPSRSRQTARRRPSRRRTRKPRRTRPRALPAPARLPRRQEARVRVAPRAQPRPGPRPPLERARAARPRARRRQPARLAAAAVPAQAPPRRAAAAPRPSVLAVAKTRACPGVRRQATSQLSRRQPTRPGVRRQATSQLSRRQPTRPDRLARPRCPPPGRRSDARRGHRAPGTAVVAQAGRPRACVGDRQVEPWASWAGALGRERPAAAAPSSLILVILGATVMAEEPDQPDDHPAEVENSQSDEEDPSLSAHAAMVIRDGPPRQRNLPSESPRESPRESRADPPRREPAGIPRIPRIPPNLGFRR